MNIKERILHYAEYKEITRIKFFEELSITYGNFRGKAKEKALNSDTIAKIIAKYPEINSEWLLTGKGEMLKGVVEKQSGLECEKCSIIEKENHNLKEEVLKLSRDLLDAKNEIIDLIRGATGNERKNVG